MYSRIYVRNRQTLQGYKYKLVSKPYAVKLEPYKVKSLESCALDFGYGRAYQRMMKKTDGVVEVERYEDKDGLYVILQPFRITGCKKE